MRAAAVGVRAPAMTSASIAASRLATAGVARKRSTEAAVDFRPHGRARLLAAPLRPEAGGFEGGAEMGDIVPDLVDAGPCERRDRAHRNLPFGERRADQAHGARVVGGRTLRRPGEFAVGLVDEDEIGELDDAALDPLQFIACRRRQDQHEHVDDFGNGGLALPGADGLDQDRVEPGGLAQEDRLARAAGDAAAAWRRPRMGG